MNIPGSSDYSGLIQQNLSQKDLLTQVSSSSQLSTNEKMRKVADEFSGFFMGMMLKSMRSTIEQSDIGHGGKGEEVFQGMADDAIGNEVGAAGGYGLSDLIYQSLARKSTITSSSVAATAGK